MRARSLIPALVVAGAVLLPTLPALASGQLPPTPQPTQKFRSFKACLAQLESKAVEDRKRADPAPIAKADGSTSQALVTSEGVKKEGHNKASYAVEFGYQFQTPQPEIRSIRTNYSYDRQSWRCNRGKLDGESVSGYALEGYAPMPGATRSP